MKKLYFIMLLLFFFFSFFNNSPNDASAKGHLLGDEKQDLSRLPYVVIPRIQYLLQASQPI